MDDGGSAGEPRDMLAFARRLLGQVSTVVGCSVLCIQFSFDGGDWVHLVVADENFEGVVDVQRLADAICGMTQHRLKYVGACTNEGGVVTLEITRAAPRKYELRVGV